MEDNVQVLATNITMNAVAEMVVVGTNALVKIHQIVVLMESTKVNGCSILKKDIIVQSDIGKVQVRMVS